MKSQLDPEMLDHVIAFHGHLCPGLMTGVRVAELVLRELGPRSSDEELVAVVETDNCAVDAIQYLLGCTFGKGNLIHLDHGQNVFTFARRQDDGGRVTALRVERKPRPEGASRDLTPDQEALMERVRAGEGTEEEQREADALWRQRSLAVLEMDEAEFLTMREIPDYELPDRASVHPSIACESCGRMTMSTRLQRIGERNVCITCAAEALSEAAVFWPIGVVRNELVAGHAPSRAKSPSSRLVIDPELAPALEGIEARQRLEVLFYLDRAEEHPPLLQRRRRDPEQPLTGVFTLRSPARPNAIGLSRVELLERRGNELIVAGLDAWDGTPILDIKPSEDG